MELTKEQETKVFEELVPIDEEEQFDEFLDECYGDVSIANYTYKTSYALKELDRTAYREELNNWLDGELREDRLYEGNDCQYYLVVEIKELLEEK